ncbi:MAG: Crp/Fnr family transcriptional regulator [Cyclobacteriaceae bacterium]|nr:Crp/Fnr family transcriptional regulator [Cyclobacteriaceae bacterium]
MKPLFTHIQQYCEVSNSTLKSLGAVLKKEELPKGAFLHTEGKVCSYIYFLEKGCLRGFYNLDGKEVTYWFAFENNFVTSFFSFITRKPGVENIQLTEDCTLWSITYEDLQELYAKHHDMERLGRIMNERYYVMLEERFLSNHFKEARERYENLLTSAPHILQRVPLGYVASYLGITQETLSRIRSKA